jgi:flagellar biosynthesis/type III secretory pathway chaperone
MNMVAQADKTAGLRDSFRAMLDRLEDILKQEIEDLRQNEYSRFAEYTRQKDLLLLDISRLTAGMGKDSDWRSEMANELKRLRNVLEENSAVINLYLATAREFADSIEDIIRRNSSDGTYTRKGNMAGYGRW